MPAVTFAPYIPPVRDRLSSSAGYMDWARDVRANLMQAGLHELVSEDEKTARKCKDRFKAAGLDAEQIVLGYVNASCTGVPRTITETCSSAYEALALLQDVYTPPLAESRRGAFVPHQLPSESMEAYIGRWIVAHDRSTFASAYAQDPKAAAARGIKNHEDARAAIDGLIDTTFAASLRKSLTEDDMVGVKLLRAVCLKDAHVARKGVSAADVARLPRRSRGKDSGTANWLPQEGTAC